jgi:hypothetical protein
MAKNPRRPRAPRRGVHTGGRAALSGRPGASDPIMIHPSWPTTVLRVRLTEWPAAAALAADR